VITTGYITIYNLGIKLYAQQSLFVLNVNIWPLILLSVAGVFIGLVIKYFGQRREWMHHKWHVGRKGYVKIHVAVDINRKRSLSLEVTSEEVHDGRMLSKLVDNASLGGNHVKSVLADGMYDSNFF
jgi:hypothetical protein